MIVSIESCEGQLSEATIFITTDQVDDNDNTTLGDACFSSR